MRRHTNVQGPWLLCFHSTSYATARLPAFATRTSQLNAVVALAGGIPPASIHLPGLVPDTLDFSIYLTPQPHYGPGLDSASDRNEYQESSWR
jgi:hypothetical protein